MKRSSINSIGTAFLVLVLAGSAGAQEPGAGEGREALPPTGNAEMRTPESATRVPPGPSAGQPPGVNTWPAPPEPVRRMMRNRALPPPSVPQSSGAGETGEIAGPGGALPHDQAVRSVSGGPLQVEVVDGMARILAENVTFGEVMNALAMKANFRTKIPQELDSRRISIALYDVPVDRAIIRLFSLVQEKNFAVKFGVEGEISNVEVITSKRSAVQDAREQRGLPGGAAAFRERQRRYSEYRMQGLPPRPPMPPDQPQTPAPPQYIPPQYVPPHVPEHQAQEEEIPPEALEPAEIPPQ